MWDCVFPSGPRVSTVEIFSITKETLMKKYLAVLGKCTVGVLAALSLLSAAAQASDDDAVLKKLKTITTISSTVPANGDINPYGLVRIPRTAGALEEGNYLISNFNASSNAQGTGTTIVEISPSGSLSLFAQIDPTKLPGPCPGGVGLTTALAVLKTGWVIVGSLPTSDGTSATAQAGCLIVLDSKGNAVETIHGSSINGPWDMVSVDGDHRASLYVTNVLNGTVAAGGSVVNQGTVVRVNLAVSKAHMPSLESITVVGAGFAERTDPAALVIGPTGVGLSPSCKNVDDADDCAVRFGEDEPVLYVADSLNNRITVITDPMTRSTPDTQGRVLSSGGSLNDPLGLTVTPDGRILVVNGNDGYVTEITPRGAQVAKTLLDNTGSPAGAGALFGIVFDPQFGVVYVDDVANSLNLLH
jgi:hypothetical protein